MNVTEIMEKAQKVHEDVMRKFVEQEYFKNKGWIKQFSSNSDKDKRE